jgi:transcriptional regulator with XRE-family HTH domain
MNKNKIIVFLNKHGWSQARIAERFNVSRARICQIIAIYKERNPQEDNGCEVCKKSLATKYEIKTKNNLIFVICEECNKKLMKIK